MKLLLLGVLLHELLALCLPVPWLVPNLTLVGLVAAVGQAPERWPWYALMAGVSVLPWMASGATGGLLLYGLLAGALAVLAHRVDLQDARLHYAAVAAGATLWTCWMLTGLAASWALLGGALLHTGVTVAAAMLWRAGLHASGR
jgi:hypothetical protein